MSHPHDAAAHALGSTPDALGFMPSARAQERTAKLARIHTLLQTHHADALWIQKHENLAWITGGADTLIYREGAPIADALVLDGDLVIVTSRIEAARLASEELPPGTRVEEVAWFEPGARAARVHALLGNRARIRDADVDLTPLRDPLLPGEQARLRAVGSAASRAISRAVEALSPEMSERAVAARAQLHLRDAGVETPVLLVAGASRLGSVRHPLPTDHPVGEVALVVVCAQRFGLIASLSRLIAFGRMPERVALALAQVQQVEAAMLDATRAHAPAADVLKAAQAAYAQVGHPSAWMDHHQGGPAGYTPRSFLATPSETRAITPGMAVAWNPSLPWAKSEDTFLLRQDGTLENLTWDAAWPHVQVSGRARAGVRVL